MQTRYRMISDRVTKRVNELNTNAIALSKKTGIPQATIYRIMNGDIKSPRSENLEPIAKALKVSIDWLVTGKESSFSIKESGIKEITEDHNIISIPIVTDKNNPNENNIIIGVDMDIEAIKNLVPSKNHRKIIGNTMLDSGMSPTINKGDILLVDQNIDAITKDGIYSVTYNNTSYIRRFQTSLKGDLKMISDNSNNETEIITQSMIPNLKVIGEVVYIWNGRRA